MLRCGQHYVLAPLSEGWYTTSCRACLFGLCVNSLCDLLVSSSKLQLRQSTVPHPTTCDQSAAITSTTVSSVRRHRRQPIRQQPSGCGNLVNRWSHARKLSLAGRQYTTSEIMFQVLVQTVTRKQTAIDRETMLPFLLTLTITLTYDLDFQLCAGCGHEHLVIVF